jgi:D-alanyl-D-alanine carboxypeptidase
MDRSTHRHLARAALAVAVLLALAASCSSSGSDGSATNRDASTDAPSSEADDQPTDPTEQELAALADDLRTTTRADGGIVAYSRGDEPPIVVVTGVADARDGQPIEPSDAFHVASITKSFTAAAVLVLVDRDELSLDDTIDEWVDWPGGDRITVRQLLHHTSGVPPFGNPGDTTQLYPQMLLDRNRAYTIEEVLDATRALTPAGEPGETVAYSNLNYILAAAIVERISGQ